MNCGDIYRWVTDRATGYAVRDKIHVYIGEAGWPEEGSLFLMVNTRDYGADYCLSAKNYVGILDYDSFISCNDVVIYEPAYCTKLGLKPIGSLTKDDCVGLRNQIIAGGAMEVSKENFCCGALAQFC